MLQHAREFHEAGIPFIFDPGQGLPMFSGDEVMNFIKLADYVAANDYEAKLLQERTGKSIEELSRLVKALVVTQGADGSLVVVNGKAEVVPTVKAAQVVDPTGCGDAYRAGLLYGIANDLDWATTGRLASLLGSIKIAQRGAQNHQFTRDEISQRFREAFGRSPW
jgi:adenosine kinase